MLDGLSGDYIFFERIQAFPMFEESVFPFALPVENPKFQMLHDCLRVWIEPVAGVDDNVKLLSSSTLTLFSFEGSAHENPKEQHISPLCTFPAFKQFGIYGGLLTHAALFSWASIEPDRADIPFQMDLTPDFRFFHVVLSIQEGAELSAPLKVCIVLDAYMRMTEEDAQVILAAQRGSRNEGG